MKSIKTVIYILIAALVGIACKKSMPTESTTTDNSNTFESPQIVIEKIKRGINIGNTLEPPTEGGWNNGPMQEYYFDDIKQAGFNIVRIPVRWEKHTAETPPFTIDETWMKRVENIIDWGLKRDLYLIVNAHHEWWFVNNYSDTTTRARFDSIWAQVSRRFANKSGKLLFEIINEPKGMTKQEVDETNERILGIIRKSNPKRIVIFGGNEWANSDELITAKIPNDDYLIGYYHSYDPWNFGGQGEGTWGSFDDLRNMENKYKAVSDWSKINNIPVMISEFGAVHACEYNSRMLHYFYNVKFALQYGVAFMAWDDGGNFGIYDRQNRTWPEVKDILVHTYPDGPEYLQGGVAGKNHVYITWTNNFDNATKITVQRKTDSSDFTNVTDLPGDATQWDEVYNGSGNIYYRIIAKFAGLPDKYSNPVKYTIQ